jgi:hypothetical protein
MFKRGEMWRAVTVAAHGTALKVGLRCYRASLSKICLLEHATPRMLLYSKHSIRRKGLDFKFGMSRICGELSTTLFFRRRTLDIVSQIHEARPCTQ